MLLKNILVATDFGDASDAALMYGRDLARTFDARLRVLHVVDNFLVRFASEAASTILPDLQRQIEEDARKRIEALISDQDR